jgi:hypothetical protein
VTLNGARPWGVNCPGPRMAAAGLCTPWMGSWCLAAPSVDCGLLGQRVCGGWGELWCGGAGQRVCGHGSRVEPPSPGCCGWTAGPNGLLLVLGVGRARLWQPGDTTQGVTASAYDPNHIAVLQQALVTAPTTLQALTITA